ncbi:MAG: hypothetical protein RBT72_06210 [Spirochaetia bacterium]|jgi:hypothetical protein|nr:hypothetical protein [Spirochaetia bacterium]
MKRKSYFLLALFSVGFILGCSNLTGGGSDLDAPTDADEAKAIYTDASNALFDAIESNSKSLRIHSKAAQALPEMNMNVNWKDDHVSMTGTISGSGTIDFPETGFEAGKTYNNVIVMSVDVDLDGTMTELEVADPNDASKTYTITGTISHTMNMDNTMNIEVDGAGIPKPTGSLSVTIDLETEYTVKRYDGVGAKFVLTFSDTKNLDLGTAPGASQNDPTCGYFATEATLKAYTVDGDLIYTTKVPLEDTPWVMSEFMGGAMGGGGQGGIEDNANQALIRSLLGALDKSRMAEGYTETVVGSVRTRTYTNYINSDTITLDGTEKTTFSSAELTGDPVAGAIDINFTGLSGGPHQFILEMTKNGELPPEYTKCTVNGTDMLNDYRTMKP